MKQHVWVPEIKRDTSASWPALRMTGPLPPKCTAPQATCPSDGSVPVQSTNCLRKGMSHTAGPSGGAGCFRGNYTGVLPGHQLQACPGGPGGQGCSLRAASYMFSPDPRPEL